MPGWTNCDIDPVYSVDVVCSATSLPFGDEIADRVYFGHTLEHLDYGTDAVLALREAYRVLRIGGELGVVGPAMDLAVETEQPQWLFDAIAEDGPDSGPGGHKWTATAENTLALVQSVFNGALVVPVAVVMREFGWPNEVDATWQVAIMASKRCTMTEVDKEAGRNRALDFVNGVAS